LCQIEELQASICYFFRFVIFLEKGIARFRWFGVLVVFFNPVLVGGYPQSDNVAWRLCVLHSNRWFSGFDNNEHRFYSFNHSISNVARSSSQSLALWSPTVALF
jgi:hypothetical protein